MSKLVSAPPVLLETVSRRSSTELQRAPSPWRTPPFLARFAGDLASACDAPLLGCDSRRRLKVRRTICTDSYSCFGALQARTTPLSWTQVTSQARSSSLRGNLSTQSPPPTRQQLRRCHDLLSTRTCLQHRFDKSRSCSPHLLFIDGSSLPPCLSSLVPLPLSNLISRPSKGDASSQGEGEGVSGGISSPPQ